ncbi:helix-turn-helix domain-containing protein [Halorhodospira halochloris]|uniref:helix-turn-helix domain-containing protein n=1 Tax=Halorhodospira halochloris TaxID=1052 RepID=UPI001EE800DB|nr:helix-turn-helix domain-containing protein [Halorhodospira halochloris]MCG5530095.1 helix-turn-helix domain-containing protein [Halorhodospira halochloris]
MSEHDQSNDPGQQLRRAREAQGLTTRAVAASLNLSAGVIEALEAGDESRLPPETFVKGYLRGYARLVGLDENEIVAAYSRTGEPSSPAIGNSAPKPRSETSATPEDSYSAPVEEKTTVGTQRVSESVAGEANQGGGAERADVDQGDTGSAASESSYAEGMRTSGGKKLIAAFALGGVALVLLVIGGTWLVLVEREDDYEQQDVAEELTDDPPEEERQTEALAEELAAADAVPDIEAEQDELEEEARDPGLVVRVAEGEDAWMEIHADGDRQVFRLVQGPETLELDEADEYNIVIGNAPAVEIEHFGEDFDLAPFTRQDVARLTLTRD